MRIIVGVLLGILASGCQPEEEVDVPETLFSPAAIDDIPLVSSSYSLSHGSSWLMELKVLENGEEWFMERRRIEGGWEGVKEQFEARAKTGAVVLKVWCGSGIAWGRVKSLIKKTVSRGVSKVEFVVKNQKGRITGLWLDIPTMGEKGEIEPLAFSVNSQGEIWLKNEEGEVEFFSNDDDWRGRLSLHESAADMSSSISVFQMGVADDLPYGRFAKLFAMARPHAEMIYLTDTDENQRQAPRERVPSLPASPFPR